MLGAVAAMVSLFYALQLPLCIAVVVEYSGKTRIGVGIGAFALRGARRRAWRSLKPARKGSSSWMEKSGWFDGVLRGAKYLYAHRLLLHIRVDGEVGGTDAARIAVCWGAAQALLDTLCACTDGRIAGSLRPAFNAPHTRGTIRVTYAVKSGTAVAAALQAVGQHLSERVKPWISIPLKA